MNCQPCSIVRKTALEIPRGELRLVEMADDQTLRDVELGDRPVVAVVERILLESTFVHEHAERIRSVVYGLGDRVSRLEGVSSGKTA